jgi:hypothetical protein
MKQLLTIAFLLGISFSPLSGSSAVLSPAPGFVIMDEDLQLTANVYMSAVSVTVSVLDYNGRVQCSATTTPGNTVILPWTDASRWARSIYRMDSGQEYVIMDEEIQ